MKIEFSYRFIKIFKKRFAHQPKIQTKFFERTRLLSQNPTNPLLNNHPLKGKRAHYYSFSVTGDIRVLYTIEGDTAYLVDIGTHNQIY